MPAAVVQALIACLTHAETATVRPNLPTIFAPPRAGHYEIPAAL